MPRLGGIPLAQKVRERHLQTKIILMSGETSRVLRVQNAFDAFLRKPFLPPALLDSV